MFYNGSKKQPDRYELKLSDAFIRADKSGNFEWTATVININPNHNTSLQKNCKALYHYIQYVGRIADNIRSGKEKKAAIEEAVEWAVDEGLLDGYFKEQRAEVMAMSLTEYDEEECIRTWRNDGIAEGREQKAMEIAQGLIELNTMSVEQIAYVTQLPIEQVRELRKTLLVNA